MKTRALSSRQHPAIHPPGWRPSSLQLPEAEVRDAIQRIAASWPGPQTAGPGWRVYPLPSEKGRLVRVEYYLDDLEGAGS